MQKLRLDRYDLWAGVIILLGTLLRFISIALGWPANYNDEGILGLMARHIAYQGDRPLVFYGQNYLGSLEAYLGASFFQLFGSSTFTLRLGLLLIFALFLLSMYLLTTLLYSKSLALITLIVLGLGAPDVLFRELTAVGGTPEYFVFTTLLLLLTAWLAMTANPPVKKLPFSRLIAYAAWGGIAGIDIYSHLLCLPYVICASVILVVFCRRELRLAGTTLVLLFLLLGMSPLIIYNATVPVTPKELSLFTGAFGGGYREPTYPAPNGTQKTSAFVAPTPIAPRPLLQIEGTILVAIPVATSGTALCPTSISEAWPLTGQTSAYTGFCTVVHGTWSVGLLVLGFIAGFTAWKGFRRPQHSPSQEGEGEEGFSSEEQRREKALQAARLMVLAGAGLSLFAFMLYPQASAVTPWQSARYLVGLLIATPALLFPLWQKRDVLKPTRSGLARLKTGTRYGLLVFVCVASLLGSIELFTTAVPAAQASDGMQENLIARLLQLGATRIYTNYDGCSSLAFVSNEQIICAVLDNGLQPGLDRYYPYRAIVASAPNPFYVFPNDSVQVILFEQKAAEQHISYKTFVVSGYTIFEPARRIAT